MKAPKHAEILAAAGLTLLGGTASGQNISDNSFLQVEKNRSIISNAQKLSQQLAEEKTDKGLMRKIIGDAHSEFERLTKGRHTRSPSWAYATILTPTELGNNYAMVVDGENETLIVFKDVTTDEKGRLQFDKEKILVTESKNKDYKVPDSNALIASTAAQWISYAQDKLAASFAQRTEAAKAIKR